MVLISVSFRGSMVAIGMRFAIDVTPGCAKVQVLVEVVAVSVVLGKTMVPVRVAFPGPMAVIARILAVAKDVTEARAVAS